MLSSRLFSPRWQTLFLGLALIFLHASGAWIDHPLFARVFLALHGGFWLAWLLTWQNRKPMGRIRQGLGLAGLLALVATAHPWTLLAWKLALLSVHAGKSSDHPTERTVNLLAVFFVGADVLLFDWPGIAGLATWDAQITPWIHAGLLFIPSLLLFIPPPRQEPGQRSDRLEFSRGMITMLAVMCVGLALFVLQAHGHWPYPVALGISLTGVMAWIAFISMFWLASGHFEGFVQLWSPHLLNIGASFEQWLAGLSQPGNYKQLTPEQFLYSGLEQLLTVPWITGVAWQAPHGRGMLGIEDKYQTLFTVQSIEATIFSRHRLHGPRHAHVKLLLQLLEYFHQSKRREEAFAEQAHLQAIHETGAKLTHDIKNLLQSLHAITSAIETAQPERFGDTQRLLQGQLPHLTQRLKRTLDKLKQPEQSDYDMVAARIWWDNLQARYRKRDIAFEGRLMWNVNVPEEVFDNVVENLLENALNKRRREPGLHVQVTLSVTEKQLKLTVCDDGNPIPSDVHKQLLSQPVQSRDGFGIGLYQAAKQTIHSGFRLSVSHNEKRKVCFELVSI